MKHLIRSLVAQAGLEAPAKTLYARVRRVGVRKWPSETSKCRERLAPFCSGYGLDLGFGGDPITDHAIRVDLPRPYSNVGQYSVQLGGDAVQLSWFRDESLDFVYSSHLLEDYPDTVAALREWLRVLKPGGRLILYCPDEQRYREHCRKVGQPYNIYHKHAHFSLQYVKDCLAQLGQGKIIHENPNAEVYNWDLVVEKRNALS